MSRRELEKQIGIGGKRMKTKLITVKVSYDTDETWEITKEEIRDILKMMNNLKRNAIILKEEDV